MEAEAAVREVASRDLACTLIAVVATPELIAVAQIGDGAAVAGDSAGNAIASTIPPCGEYINETIFLISPNAVETAQFQVHRGKNGALGCVFRRAANASSQNPRRNTPTVHFLRLCFDFLAIFKTKWKRNNS